MENKACSKSRRKVFKFSIAVQIFILAGSSGVSLSVERPDARSQQSARRMDDRSTKRNFDSRTEKSGDLIQDGVALGFTVHQAPDGVSLTVTYNAFEDPSEASASFDKELVRVGKPCRRATSGTVTGK